MQEYTTKAKLEILPIPSTEIVEGIKGIMYVGVTEDPAIVTIEHLNATGYEWVGYDSSGEMHVSEHIWVPIVTIEAQQISLRFKDWNHILKNNLEGKTIEVIVTPHKFKHGKSLRECTECNSYFDGAPSQGICMTCCMLFSTASIKKRANAKVIKKGRYTHVQMRQIAEWAYELCVDNTIDFNEFGKLIDRYLETDGNHLN